MSEGVSRVRNADNSDGDEGGRRETVTVTVMMVMVLTMVMMRLRLMIDGSCFSLSLFSSLVTCHSKLFAGFFFFSRWMMSPSALHKGNM